MGYRSPGQVAYEMWSSQTGVEHFLMPWRSLSPQEKVAWEHAVNAAAEDAIKNYGTSAMDALTGEF